MSLKISLDTGDALNPDRLLAGLEGRINAGLTEMGAEAVPLIREVIMPNNHARPLVRRAEQNPPEGEAPEPSVAQVVDPVTDFATSLSANVDVARQAVIVTSDSPTGNYIEFGTMEFAARPFLREVAEKLHPRFVQILARHLGLDGERSP